jgi:hypothetical protein
VSQTCCLKGERSGDDRVAVFKGITERLGLAPVYVRSAHSENGTGGRIRTRVGAVLETAAKPLSYTRVLVAAAGDDPAA